MRQMCRFLFVAIQTNRNQPKLSNLEKIETKNRFFQFLELMKAVFETLFIAIFLYIIQSTTFSLGVDGLKHCTACHILLPMFCLN